MPGEQHNPEWPWVHRTYPSHVLNCFWRGCGFWSSTNCCVTVDRQISVPVWSFVFSTVMPANPRPFRWLSKSNARQFRVLKGMCWFIEAGQVQLASGTWNQRCKSLASGSHSSSVSFYQMVPQCCTLPPVPWGLKLLSFIMRQEKRLLSPSSSFKNSREDL